MSTAAPLPRTPSSRRSQQQTSYSASAERDRLSRTQSSTSRSSRPSSPRRSMSAAQRPNGVDASSHTRAHSTNLDNVARYDYEQSNVARTPSSTRRSESHDRPMQHVNPTRAEPTRTTSSSHTRSHSRYDQPQPVPSSDSRSSQTASQTLKRRTNIESKTGVWELGKTIGAGSMGKVKLARNRDTGELVAVKIVPRQSTEHEHRSQAERERADHSKEVRTAREAAIMMLVDHPYICGMRDVVRTNYHWYMMCEYVNGGQMLDYIISHGRLKEKQARKFGRQIASALDYCHRNSIVHRDLKIENILISKTGDIKIIDFGLSNLFSPRSHLKTFCGSLYFAAPELLQAKQYTGPEVDIWSFGIVLYVLVCGKVPFDDQSMPQLHAKIKKGVVEYPPWLTPECRNLIAKMLTTDPTQRATLTEIMNHSWMTKGFNGPPDNFLPQTRKPLQLPLNPAVVDKMTGFDFGSAETITTQLTRVLESEDYQRAMRMAERRGLHQQTPEFEKKRGVFDFYKRRNSISSRDTLNTPSSEAVQLGNDPLNAYNPYISIYFLAQEKMEREAKEVNPGGTEMPKEPGEKPLPIPGMPEPPQAAYTNTAAYEMAGEKPTGGRSRPRARTHGEDEVTEGLKNINVDSAPSPMNPAIVEPTEQQTPPAQKRESTAAGLLRRLSTRRYKDPAERERPDRSHPPPSLAVYAPPQSDSPRKSFSVRRTRERDSSGTRPETSTSGRQEELLSPPNRAHDAVKRSGGLARSISVNSSDMRRKLTRRGTSEANSLRPSLASANSHDSERQGGSMHASSDVESRPRNQATRTMSVQHKRRGSMQTRRSQRRLSRTSDVPEETDQELQDDTVAYNAEPESSNGNGIKPVYLKGLFSVSTTSSRPLNVIRTDIIRVLGQLGVDYKEIRGGFSCKHSPSIESAKGPSGEVAPSGAAPLTPSANEGGHRRKISFGGFWKESSRDEFRGNSVSRAARASTSIRDQQPSNTASEDENENSEYEDAVRGSSRDQRGSGKLRAAGETSTHVQNDMGENMSLRFEIFIVKVPLLSLHGIQFKKVDGGTWQYKNMAQTILNELRL